MPVADKTPALFSAGSFVVSMLWSVIHLPGLLITLSSMNPARQNHQPIYQPMPNK